MTDREIIHAIANRLEMRAQQWRDNAKEHRDAEREERRILISGAHRAAAQLADGLANGIEADMEWIDSLLTANPLVAEVQRTQPARTEELPHAPSPWPQPE